MAEIFNFTASQAQAKLREGTLSIEQLAETLLSRIEIRDATTHAWAYLDPDYILEQAKQLDRVPPTQRGPLHGIPIGIKDVLLTNDMPTQYNSPIYENDAAKVDAAAVKILRKAGALIFGNRQHGVKNIHQITDTYGTIGKTSTTEFAAGTVGPSYKGPKTSNPHDPSRTPGGSSAGSGAAVGDFQIPIALGTQTIGSVIRPASFNGVYGMKPTWNLISREGSKLYSLIFDTIGVFARSVDDLKLMLDSFHIADDEPETGFNLQGAKFAFITFPTPEWPELGPGSLAALKKGADLLRAHGAEVEELALPDEFRNMYKYHLQVLAGDARVAFQSEYDFAKAKIDPMLIDLVENKGRHTKKDQTKAFDELSAMRPKFDVLADRYAAIIAPSVLDEAPVGHGNTGNPAFCAPWTAMHMPVVNVPGFEGENGLPIGLSVVASRNRDQYLLKVCAEVGRVFESEGGWKRRV